MAKDIEAYVDLVKYIKAFISRSFQSRVSERLGNIGSIKSVRHGPDLCI